MPELPGVGLLQRCAPRQAVGSRWHLRPSAEVPHLALSLSEVPKLLDLISYKT